LGLGFVLFISTWIFSGLMSMFPWGIFDNATRVDEQIVRYQGGAIDQLDSFPALNSELMQAVAGVKEVEWRRIGDTRYLVLSQSATQKSVMLPDGNTNKDALHALITGSLHALQPQARIQQQRVISQYDSWYYSHHNRYRPLPALEVRFDDAFINVHRFEPSGPFSLAPNEIFLGDHFKNRPDVLSHSAVEQNEA
jgi:hypothetical protein